MRGPAELTPQSRTRVGMEPSRRELVCVGRTEDFWCGGRVLWAGHESRPRRPGRGHLRAFTSVPPGDMRSLGGRGGERQVHPLSV